jgi:transcriptional regulator with XRE-family HTH domain
MALDRKFFGEKLKRCRSQLELSIAEVQQKTGIDEARLTKLEEGELEPTGDEVLIFSDLFRQNYNFFISNQQKAASEQIDILYRRFGGDFAKEDRQAIQEFIFLCENEQFIFNIRLHPRSKRILWRLGNMRLLLTSVREFT